MGINLGEALDVHIKNSLDDGLICLAQLDTGVSWKFNSLRREHLLVSVKIGCVQLQKLLIEPNSLWLVAQSMVDLAKHVSFGDGVDNFGIVFSDERQSLRPIFLRNVGTNTQEDNLTDFMGLHATLRLILFLKLEHAIN